MSTVSRLLYVDSDTDRAIASAKTFSTEFDFEVYTAHDIATATTTLEGNRIDCVVSEFELTDGNGLELLSHIRSVNRSLPVILVVDAVPETVESEAFESGTTEIVQRTEIVDSYDPLVDRLHDLLAQTPDGFKTTKSQTKSPTGGATSTTAASQYGTISAATEDSNTKAESKVSGNAVLDGISKPNPTRSELQTLEKDELIDLVLQLSGNPDSPTTSASEADKPSPPTEETNRTETDVTATETATTTESPSEAPSGEADYLSQLDLSPGTTIFVQCSSQPGQKDDVHQALLGGAEQSDPNILLVRYRPLPEAQLESIAATANQITVLTISCTQSVPKSIAGTVETTQIDRVAELRRLGILATRIVENWEAHDGGISVSIDPLESLFDHKTVEAIFRFLHVLLGKLSSRGAVTQVHITPSEVDGQDSNIIKPLFDQTVIVDSQDVLLDSTL